MVKEKAATASAVYVAEVEGVASELVDTALESAAVLAILVTGQRRAASSAVQLDAWRREAAAVVAAAASLRLIQVGLATRSLGQTRPSLSPGRPLWSELRHRYRGHWSCRVSLVS